MFSVEYSSESSSNASITYIFFYSIFTHKTAGKSVFINKKRKAERRKILRHPLDNFKSWAECEGKTF